MNRKDRRAADKRNPNAAHQASSAPSGAQAQARELRNLAATMFSMGQIAGAEAQLQQAVALTPRDPDLLDQLGHVRIACGQIEAAAEAFEKALKQRQKAAATAAERTLVVQDYARLFVHLGGSAHALGQSAQALTQLERALALGPDLAEVHNGLGSVLMAQGRATEAARHLERALTLAPELYESYGAVLQIFFTLFPTVREGVARAAQAWPGRLDAHALLGADGLAAVAGNAFLHHLLAAHTVCDLEFEQFLTMLRPLLAAAALEMRADDDNETVLLALTCALARQCFLNDYVFALTPDEARLAARLHDAVTGSADAGAPLTLAALAMYEPLGALPAAERIAAPRSWPAPFAAVVTQQIDQPRAEREAKPSIPTLTPITDAVSAAVRRQYEENPYPHWVAPASAPTRPNTLYDELERQFPAAPPPVHEGPCNMLVAGCGTGRHPIEMARKFADVQVLAIDLSLASLAYAQRKALELTVGRIEFAQADILELGGLDRTFDAIDAGGVLHHLADPFTGWRILWEKLRPGGVMRVSLYSALARRNIVAAQHFVQEHGFTATPDGIRDARSALIASPLRGVASIYDFFSVSECRDLLFHVQEHNLALPAIKAFLDDVGARLIGFEVPGATLELYRRKNPHDATMTDLDHWHAFEQAHPDTFAGMYQFWIVKRDSTMTV